MAAIHLLGNTEAGELLKIPRLITHYQQHRCNDSRIGFADFIIMHYINGDDGTHTDDWQDNQLPCHNTKQKHSFSQIFSKSLKPIDIEITILIEKKVFGGRLRQNHTSECLSVILQPPRV